MKRLFLLFFSIILTSCNVPNMTEIAISPNFSENEQEVILKAIDDLFEAIPELYQPYVVISKDNGKGSINHPKDEKLKRCKRSYGTSGYTTLSPFKAPRIQICDWVYKTDHLYETVRHELGHAFGESMKHLDEGNVMTDNVFYQSKEYTKADKAYFLKE